MKIAIQLYGHLRTFLITAPYLMQNIVNANADVADCDIFIHTWDELDAKQQMPHYKKAALYMGANLTNDMKYRMLEEYNPVAYKIEHQNESDDHDLQDIEFVNGNISMATSFKNGFYSFKSVNQLRREYEIKNGFIYDYVITTRPDILFFRPFSLRKILAAEGNWSYFTKRMDEFIFSPYIVGYSDVIAQDRYVPGLDLFCFASSNVMNIFLDYEYDIKTMYPMWIEQTILFIANKEDVQHQFLGYEKDRCWTICRLNPKMKKKNDTVFSKIVNEIYRIQIPLFIHSELFCRNTCLNVTTYKDKAHLNNYIKRMLD